jgi:hypothetical protein
MQLGIVGCGVNGVTVKFDGYFRSILAMIFSS